MLKKQKSIFVQGCERFRVYAEDNLSKYTRNAMSLLREYLMQQPPDVWSYRTLDHLVTRGEEISTTYSCRNVAITANGMMYGVVTPHDDNEPLKVYEVTLAKIVQGFVIERNEIIDIPMPMYDLKKLSFDEVVCAWRPDLNRILKMLRTFIPLRKRTDKYNELLSEDKKIVAWIRSI